MDGLGCNEILKSSIIKGSPELRIDSEYYSRCYLQYDKIIRRNPGITIGEFAYVTDGIHTSIEFDENSHINLISAKSPKENYFDLSGNGYISCAQHYANPRTALKKGDIILSTVGTIGKCAVVDDTVLPANSDRHVAIIRVKERYNPYYVSTFLLSKYGRYQCNRFITGNVQPNLFLDKIRNIIVPCFSESFQEKVKQIVLYALNRQENSQAIFHEAERILKMELGMKDFRSTNKTDFTKTFSSSFLESGRLDAEYYQPKYENFEKHIKVGDYVLAGDICSDICYGTVPTSPYTMDGSGVPYIKEMNIKNTFVDNLEDLDRITNTGSLPDKFYTKAGDIIISQMGTVADCGVISKKHENCLFGFFTIRLRLKNTVPFVPLFVGLYIQLLAKPYYFYRNIAHASVRQNTDLPTVQNLFIPKLDLKKQILIADKVQQFLNFRNVSNELFESAKFVVEVAIENGEDAALRKFEDIECLQHCSNLQTMERHGD